MKKRILSIMAAGAAAMFFTSCEHEKVNCNDRIANEEVLLSVGLQDVLSTKGQTAWTKQQENAIVSWQVFVFNDDGSLDVSAFVNGSGGTTLKCTSGQKTVYALVNHPSNLVGKDGINDLDALLCTKSNLSDNTAGTSFVMSGSVGVNLSSSSSSLTIPVSRICSKVYIDSVENQLSGSYGKITIKGMYITNAAGDAVIGDEEYTIESSGKWYNKMGYSASGVAAVEALLSETSLSEVISKGSSTSTPHYFYCYPNRSSSTKQAGQWSPRCSRLVIETVIEGDTQEKRYYVIKLVDAEGEYLTRNKYYHIKKLVIKHLGSTDPDTEANIGDLSVDISVSEWGEGFEEETIYY